MLSTGQQARPPTISHNITFQYIEYIFAFSPQLSVDPRKVEASVVYAQYKQALDGCVDFVQTNLYTYFLTWSDVYPSYFEQFELFKRVPKQGARPAKNKESQEVPTAMEAMPDEQSMVYTTAPDEVAQAPYAHVANG